MTLRYVCLLRGINVGGKNKVAMADLRGWFEDAGFGNVKTYINSGNVIFDSSERSPRALNERIEELIEGESGFPVRVCVISADDFRDAIGNPPDWWGEAPDTKHNAIFVIAPAKAEDVIAEVGEAKPELEQIAHRGPVIFWSAPLAGFNRTRWKGVVGSSSYANITIRNANTARKLLAMLGAG